MTTEALPVLADAANILSDQLQTLLKRLAKLLEPAHARLEAQFQKRLEKLEYNAAQRRALAQLTPGAVAAILNRGGTPADFFEGVAYHGQRLAKLNVLPGAIVSVLGEYDKLLTPLLRKLAAAERKNLQWVRDQLHFCVMLSLNNSYYHVREAETQAFYELFWAEVESRRLDTLLPRLLETLARFCRADQAQLYLASSPGQQLARRAVYGSVDTAPVSVKPTPRSVEGLMQPRCFKPGPGGSGGSGLRLTPDPAWTARFASCWSVPMFSRGRLAGVIQFVFHKDYEWLPREQELLTAAAERCMLAAEKARLLDDLGAREVMIRGLAERMMHVEEAERRRISRELHDQTGQDLLWIRLQMEMLEKEIPESEQRWKTRLSEVRDMTERTIVEIRRLIAALSPSVLEQMGLAAALRQLIKRFEANHASRVRLQIGRLGEINNRLEVIVYRLVQECLNNIAKHSFCTQVNISVHSSDGHLRLCVEDNGVGFVVDECLNKPGSFGLAGIRERVALLGGRCQIESRLLRADKGRGGARGTRRGPSGWTSGTVIRVDLPMRQGELPGVPQGTPEAADVLGGAS